MLRLPRPRCGQLLAGDAAGAGCVQRHGASRPCREQGRGGRASVLHPTRGRVPPGLRLRGCAPCAAGPLECLPRVEVLSGGRGLGGEGVVVVLQCYTATLKGAGKAKSLRDPAAVVVLQCYTARPWWSCFGATPRRPQVPGGHASVLPRAGAVMGSTTLQPGVVRGRASVLPAHAPHGQSPVVGVPA